MSPLHVDTPVGSFYPPLLRTVQILKGLNTFSSLPVTNLSVYINFEPVIGRLLPVIVRLINFRYS